MARELAERLHCGPVSSSPRVAKLSVSGIGMRSHTGVAIRMFRSLAEAGINVEMINTSEVRVNVVVDGDKGPQGLACLQQRIQRRDPVVGQPRSRMPLRASGMARSLPEILPPRTSRNHQRACARRSPVTAFATLFTAPATR